MKSIWPKEKKREITMEQSKLVYFVENYRYDDSFQTQLQKGSYNKFIIGFSYIAEKWIAAENLRAAVFWLKI